MNNINDFKDKFNELNKKLDAILKIQDFILNEIPELGQDKNKILKSSPPLPIRESDVVGKYLVNQRANQSSIINQSNGSFGVPNNSIYKLLSQSGHSG